MEKYRKWAKFSFVVNLVFLMCATVLPFHEVVGLYALIGFFLVSPFPFFRFEGSFNFNIFIFLGMLSYLSFTIGLPSYIIRVKNTSNQDSKTWAKTVKLAGFYWYFILKTKKLWLNF